MTAGSDVIHSEMPAQDLVRHGGRMHGFQLWVNLPRRDKLMPPRYQELQAQRIPSGRSADGLASARVIAGEALGVRAATETRTPIMYIHFIIQPGGAVLQPVPAGFNAFAYVVAGQASFGDGATAQRGEAAIFRGDAGAVRIGAEGSPAPASVLLIAGAPIREPIVRYGPFVMNTRQEIYQAIEDYQSGAMGSIPATVSRS